jgi:ABC-type dipeptide/oligopeptide/nickel transport system permease component
MIRSIAVRLVALPLILWLVNAAAYCFAVLAQYRRAVSLVPPGEPLPPFPSLLAMYGGYAGGLGRGDLGVLPYGAGSDPVAGLVGSATLASLGLLGIALVLSIAAGMLLGLSAVRRDPPGVALWLTSFATVGLATPLSERRISLRLRLGRA